MHTADDVGVIAPVVVTGLAEKYFPTIGGQFKLIWNPVSTRERTIATNRFRSQGVSDDGTLKNIPPSNVKKAQQTAVKNVVGTRVRQARQRPSVRLSQVGLSTCLIKSGLSICRTAVSKIESGERYVADYELIGLAKCLQVSTAWLLGETTSYTGSRRLRKSV